MIEDGEQILTEDLDIRNSAERFYKNLLSEEEGSLGEPNLDILSSLPAHIDVDQLVEAPSVEEVRKAVFDINAESAAGPDGAF